MLRSGISSIGISTPSGNLYFRKEAKNVFDYTPEGIRANQSDIALSYLHLMDKKLAKIDRSLKFMIFAAIGTVVFNHVDDIKEFIKRKGE